MTLLANAFRLLELKGPRFEIAVRPLCTLNSHSLA
jgi:hypothetical protein